MSDCDGQQIRDGWHREMEKPKQADENKDGCGCWGCAMFSATQRELGVVITHQQFAPGKL